MSGAGKTIAYIAAAIFIFFGVLFIWGAFSAEGQPGWIIIGIISAGIGLVLVYFASRKPKIINTQVNVNLDLPGGVSLDQVKCKSCGGVLTPENIKLVAGAPMVSCPYCNSTYQMTEDPKW